MVDITIGVYSTIALKSDGTVWAWGYNCNGQLGNRTTTDSLAPVQAIGLSNVVDISCGGGMYTTIALKSDGTVWAWGQNDRGTLGNGTTTNSLVPVQVSGLSNVTAISGCKALKSNGTVWAWGQNDFGQLGNGTTQDSLVPVQVSGLSNVVAISSTGASDACLALKSDGTVWAWGRNDYGQLGNNTTQNKPLPVQVIGLSNVVALSSGAGHTLALKSDGTVWAWGYNSDAELGNNTKTNSLVPVQVPGLSNVASVYASFFGSAVLKNDGTVWTWGLGEGNSTISRLVPTQSNFHL